MNHFRTIDTIETTNQYKLEHISYNQCSWFCIEVLLEIKKLGWNIDLSDKKSFSDWCNNILVKASEKRKNYGKLSWGESLFSKLIHSSNNYNLHITTIKKCEYLIDSNEKNLIYIDTMKDIQNYKNNLESITFQEICKNIRHAFSERRYMMINRFGQSFLIYPIDSDKFVIFDSHKSEIMVVNLQNLQLYILQNPSSYSFIIYVEGQMDEFNMQSSIINMLYDDTK